MIHVNGRARDFAVYLIPAIPPTAIAQPQTFYDKYYVTRVLPPTHHEVILILIKVNFW